MPKPLRITWRCGRRILGVQREPPPFPELHSATWIGSTSGDNTSTWYFCMPVWQKRPAYRYQVRISNIHMLRPWEFD